MTATAEREQLRQLRERTKAARQKMAAGREALKLARDAGDANAQFAAEQIIEQGRGEEAMASELEKQILSSLAGVGNRHGVGFMDDPEARAMLERVAGSSMPHGRLELGEYMSQAETVNLTGRMVAGRKLGQPPTPGLVDPTDEMQRGRWQGIVPSLQAPLSFLDMVPTALLDQASFVYSQEVSSVPASGGIGGIGAGVIAPGEVKPQATISYEDAEAKARVVAAWTKVSKVTLADVPQLQSAIEGRLMYGVLQALEAEVIAGDGTGEHLRGLLHTTGLGSVPYSAVQTADLLLDGITTVLVSGARPNVACLNPLDWSDLLKSKSSGSGEYVAGPFASLVTSVWGVPLLPALGVPQGQAIIGDTVLGLQLMVREGVHVVVSDADADDFSRNRCSVLAEGRWALPVFRPAAFCLVDLAA